ncbi:MAG: glycosyltransferase family 4 protein [Vicinamibacterales bacterium]
MNKANVYLINLSFGLAGIERRFANIWRTLRSRGNVRPVLVVPDTLATILYEAGLADPDPDIWEVAEHRVLRSLSGIGFPPLGEIAAAILRSRAMAWSYRRVWERIRSDPSAVVHIGMNCSALVPPAVPLVYECVDSTLSQLGTRHFVRASSRRCIVHCQTGRIRRALEQTMADRQTRWITVHSPCYFASYPELSDPAPARDSRLVAFVGRMAPEKRPLLFLEAIVRARSGGLDVRGLMLGEGPLQPQLQRYISDHHLESVVEVGFGPNPFERLQRAAIFVSLQSGDNFGSQSLLEAMGAGCAVVATAVGETGRLVTPDVGLLVDPDPAEVAGAISELVRDPAGTEKKGAAASDLARTQYSADAYASFLESLYCRAIDLHGHEASSIA